MGQISGGFGLRWGKKIKNLEISFPREGSEEDIGFGIGLFLDEMFKKENPGFEGGIVRDPMFVVCCVINNNTFELWSDLTINQGIAGVSGGRASGNNSSSSKTNLFLY